MTQKSRERAAFFAGSFNPYTIGHHSITTRGLDIFDHIIIGVGHNADKPAADIAAIVDNIRQIYANESRVSVVAFTGLAVDAAYAAGACALLKGVRSCRDFEYERDQADINRRIAGIETVILFAIPELGAISSSLVRDLKNHNADISKFIPKI